MQGDPRNIVAKFGKALTLGTDLPGSADTELWIALGYFDTLQFHPLDADPGHNWLEAIWKYNLGLANSLTDSFYYHPLHMLENIHPENVEYQSFWDWDAPFLFLSLIQEAMPTEEESKKADTCQTFGDVLQHFSLSDGNTQVKLVSYHTMELSDRIVLWKSNSLTALLEKLQALHQLPLICDMDTFAAVNYKFLKGQRWKASVLPDEKKPIYFSTQFIVRDTEQKSRYLKELYQACGMQDCAFFTMGMDDLHIVQNSIPVSGFLDFLYQTLFHPPVNEAFRAAFSDCSTHIGLSEADRPSPPKPEGDKESEGDKEPEGNQKANISPLTQRCQSLLTRFQASCPDLSNTDSSHLFSWLKPAGNLCSVLLDMSRDPVLDGFCFLVLDAAEVFCEYLEDWNSKGAPQLKSKQLELVQRFVRGWGTLMEQVTRTDGRFIQKPGFSPSLCEIPARLLEFYLAFSNLCVKEMFSGGTDDQTVALLLVPKICRKIKVDSILQSPRSKRHLLYVDIPLQMLYDPLSVLCCICHEISHFAGSGWRNRPTRKMELIYAAATELSFQLDLNEPAVVTMIYQDIKQLCAPHGDYLQDVLDCLSAAIQALTSRTDIYQKWLSAHSYNRSNGFGDNGLWQLDRLSLLNSFLSENYSKLTYLLHNIRYLFQECYADVAMVCLLKLDRSTYLHLAEPALAETGSQPNKESLDYSLTVLRWAALLCLDTLWQHEDAPPEDFLVWAKKEKQGRLSSFVQDILQVRNRTAWEPPRTQPLGSSETFEHLMLYLEKCCRTIKDTCAQANHQQTPYAAFSRMAIDHTLDCDACISLIQQYRESLLSKNQ